MGVASQKGFMSEREDFAQWAFIKRLEGSRGTATQLFIDYCRIEFGDTRVAKGRAKSFGMLGGNVEFSSENHCLPTALHIAAEDTLNLFQGTDRAMLVMAYKWGLLRSEIAEAFGISSASVTNRFKRMRKKLSGGF